MNECCTSSEVDHHAVLKLLTVSQGEAIQSLAERFGLEEMNWSTVTMGGSGLPLDWALCQVGPIVVGVSPTGEIHS